MVNFAGFVFWLVGGIIFFYFAMILWEKISVIKKNIDKNNKEKSGGGNNDGQH